MALNQPNGVLEDIAADIGYTATTALVDWYGGGSLYIPDTTAKDHNIRHVIGDRAFARLVASYGGQTIDIPIDYRRERTRRNKLIGALVVRGVSDKKIARIATMTETQVRNIRTQLEVSLVLPVIAHADAPIGALDGGDAAASELCHVGAEMARRDLLILSLSRQLADERRRNRAMQRDDVFARTVQQPELFDDCDGHQSPHAEGRS